jgi:LmbE family N-acetylglucosaminyl deacetylase
MSGVPQGRVLIVSPHLDDAALSCAALLDRPERSDVLTVFAGSPDPPCQGHWDEITGFANSKEALATRLEEEQAALASSVRELRWLELLDAQYLDGERDPADAAAITAAVENWLGGGGEECVALPAGAGRSRKVRRPPRRHPDHVFVRDVLLPELVGRSGTEVLLYEELPYRWGGRAPVPALGSWEVIELPVDRERKAARNRAYRSQVRHLTSAGRRLDRAASLPAEERYLRLVEP